MTNCESCAFQNKDLDHFDCVFHQKRDVLQCTKINPIKDRQWQEYLDFGPHGLSVIRNSDAHRLRVKMTSSKNH